MPIRPVLAPFATLARLLPMAVLALSAPAVHAQDKVALLIGNSAYPGTPSRPAGWSHLDNPTNDVTLVGKALGEIGFAVTVVPDGDWKTLDAAVDAFARQNKSAPMMVFYFAGHGFEYARRNYLVPIDAPSKVTEDDLPKRFLDFDHVAQRLTASRTAAQTTIFLLDACRTGGSIVAVDLAGTVPATPAPASAIAVASIGTNTGARGTTLGSGSPSALMRHGVNDYDFPPGAQVAVLYSTGRGIPARDAAPPPANYSPFAWEVAQRIAVPHVEISTVFNAIRQGVYDRTVSFAPPQAPYTYNSLSPNVYLNPSLDRIALARPTGPAAGLPPKPIAISASDLERVDEPVLIVRVLSEHSVDDITRLADGGDAMATYLLGYMQEFGMGVPRDLAKARATLEKAAASGTPSGQLELAYLLHHNPTGAADLDRAVDLYKAAAQQGFAKARGHYASVLMTGRLVPNTPDNYAAGLAQLRLAAEARYPYAMFSLALYDEPGARGSWRAGLQTLADKGDADAHHWLCSLDVEGKRYADAMPHCSVAASAGFPDSQAHMALAANEGWVAPRSSRDALHWMRQALSRPELDAGLRARMLSMRMELERNPG